MAEYHNQRYASDPDYRQRQIDKATARHKDLKALAREAIREAKDRPCADCGIQYPTWVMDLDHVEEKAPWIIERGMARTASWVTSLKKLDMFLEEIKKCKAVCANCHRLRHPPNGRVQS